jgi:hypothetical protein
VAFGDRERVHVGPKQYGRSISAAADDRGDAVPAETLDHFVDLDRLQLVGDAARGSLLGVCELRTAVERAAQGGQTFEFIAVDRSCSEILVPGDRDSLGKPNDSTLQWRDVTKASSLTPYHQ